MSDESEIEEQAAPRTGESEAERARDARDRPTKDERTMSNVEDEELG